MNFSAAATFFEPVGMARLHAQSQLEFFPSPAFGASAKPTLSATFESFGLVTKDAATVASIHIAHLPALNSARFSLKPLELAPGGPAAFIRSTYVVSVFFHSGLSNCGCHFSSNQRAPNELDIAVRNAMFSPHPALPRRQMPYTPADLSVSFFAASITKSQVGVSGIVNPAFWNRSVRYMVIELSP